MADVKITIIVENRSGRADLGAEHGWSVLVETGGVTGLFDTGASDLVARNAARLGVDLSALSWVALSHGHYDHAGGLGAVLDAANGVDVYAHPEAFLPKHVYETDGTWRYAGMALSREDVEARGGRVHLAAGPVELPGGATLTGEVPRETDYETVPARFQVDRDGERVRDSFPDDQALVMRTDTGLVVLLGARMRVR